jgi:outer membrane protein assembly factor BamB
VKKLLLLCLMLITSMSINRPVFSQVPDIHTWPEFRGNNSSGIAHPDQNPPVDLMSGDKLLWKTPVISGASSTCIWGDRIFLTGYDKEKKQLQVMCYDRSNGKLIWNRIVPAKEIEPHHAVGSPADPTPATDGERVYVHFGSYGLLCYDFAGELVWTHELPPRKSKYGTGSSPIIVDNMVILIVRRPNKDLYLLALDRKSGRQVWKHPLGRAGPSTPILWDGNLVIHHPGGIAGHSVEDGSETWSVKVPTTGENTPVANSDMLYVGTFEYLGELRNRLPMPTFQDMLTKHDANGDTLVSKEEFPKEFPFNYRPEMEETPDGVANLIEYWGMVDPDKNGIIDGTEWQAYLDYYERQSIDHGLIAIKSGGSGDITANHILWKKNEGVPEVPSPLYYNGRVYMVKSGGIVTCVNAVTGELFYRERLGASGPYFSSPVAANDWIYVASRKGTVVVFEAGDKLKVLARNNLREKILATPAIVDNKLYIRTAKHLYAFGE